MNYKILDIEYYLPEVIIDNDYLQKECDIDKDFTENKVGIKERRIAKPDETTSDMATQAARKLLDKHNIAKDEIDLLIVCTQNPDYRLPTTACIVQHKLGLHKDIMAFDINLGCSGFTHSLPIAGNMIKTGAIKNALIIMSEQYSKVTNFKDRNTASIFGDAAAAALITPCEDGYGVLDFNYGTDDSGAEKLVVWNSGVATDKEKDNYLFMDGREIFKFSMMTVPKYLKKLYERNNISSSDIKKFVFHQANKYMLSELQKRLKIEDAQMVISMQMTGNTVSSTIPIAYKKVLDEGSLQKGDLVIFAGFGVGLSWSNVLYRHI